MFCCLLSLFYYLIFALIAVFVAIFSALAISEQFRKAFFAKIFIGSGFINYLKSLFDGYRPVWLNEFSQLKPTAPAQKLKVLEVGVGGGANFEQYPDNCSLTVLDYNENFKDEFMKNIKKYPNIEFVKYWTGTVEDMHQIDDNAYDVVLVTHVFCSVGDVLKGLKDINRVLKKGGKYFFIEHVAYNEESFANNVWSMIQCILNPFWKLMMCGCHLNRKTWTQIEKAGFKSVKVNHVFPSTFPGFLRAQIWGCAVK